jgi:hypothetical protein
MKKCIITISIIFVSYTHLSAQQEIDTTDTIQTSYFYEPYPQEVGNSILQLGGSFTLLPTSVVENEFPTPAIDLQYKRGIFKNISFIGSFSTNYFTNLLHVGLQFNWSIEKFSISIANHFGGFVGQISVDGQFDNNSAYAFFYLPILRVGYRNDKFSISTSFAISYIIKSVSRVSDLEARGPDRTLNDIFVTIAIEQPFLKSTYLSIGLSLTYSRSPYQSWLLFNTIDEYLFVPEFFFGFQL